MSHAVERMIGEGKSKGELERDLGSKRESAKRSGKRRGLEVPSEKRRHEICQREGVETAGERDTGDTVKRGPNPCDLGLVDAEMGRDGAVETLLRKDHVGILAFICGGGRWSSRALACHVLFIVRREC